MHIFKKTKHLTTTKNNGCGLGKTRPGRDRTWTRADLGKTGPGQDRTWSSRTRPDLGKSGPGQDRTWSSRTRPDLDKSGLGQDRTWTRPDMSKSGQSKSGLTPTAPLIGHACRPHINVNASYTSMSMRVTHQCQFEPHINVNASYTSMQRSACPFERNVIDWHYRDWGASPTPSPSFPKVKALYKAKAMCFQLHLLFSTR